MPVQRMPLVSSARPTAAHRPLHRRASASLGAILAVVLLALPAAHAQTAPAGMTAVDAFTTLRGLIGRWTGTTDSGHPMVIEFASVAGGTAVGELQSPASSDEMLTIYNLQGDDLVLTHYCPMGEHGNQPHMVLDRQHSSPAELRFAFTSLTNLDPAKDMHVHDGRIVIRDADHIDREWNIYDGGKQVMTARFRLTRQGAGAEKGKNKASGK